MRDINAIGDALKEVLKGLEPTPKDIRKGIGDVFKAYPACEIIMQDWQLSTRTASSDFEQDEAGVITIAFYVPLYQDAERKEEELISLAVAFVNLTQDEEAFDHTLGGLVDDFRCTALSFDVIVRNKQAYRYVSIDCVTGDVTADI